jgi:hypothetical protein
MKRVLPPTDWNGDSIPDTPAIRRARELGIDIGLLRSMLRLTPEERLRRLDSDIEFFRSARKVVRRP